MRIIAAFSLALGLCLGMPAAAQTSAPDKGLTSLQTGDDSRGWEAVGRINFGERGFCTGALIADDLVLTAAHCLFDKETGARVDPATIQFLAGWRNGRAVAYRGVKQAIAHSEYVFGGHEDVERVQFDVALLKLDQPIRLPSIKPFVLDAQPQKGDEVGVVSYAQDRSEAPSLQQVCHVLGRSTAMLILSCDVDFGSSGAPVFALRDGAFHVVSLVSAKAEMDGRKVALGAPLTEPVAELRAELDRAGPGQRPGNVRVLSGGAGGKFIKP
jgi:V8-like Glu-specific endopeptidase